ncbi:hypothetical protein SEVIR_5G032900v4 [Setaria viridis]|nr:hypothetical protein SEVIR_5G032900v2 [Setaria viridis]
MIASAVVCFLHWPCSDAERSATATCTSSVNLGLVSIERYIGCWIFYGSGAKTSIRCLCSETEHWGYNSLNEVANPSILFVILHCLSAKRNALIHDTMIGRCNGILIVPMCLWILLRLNKQNRLSLIERFIIGVIICTSRLFLMLRSFRCSLVKIFWGSMVF